MSKLGLVEEHRRAAAAIDAQLPNGGKRLIGREISRTDRQGPDSSRGHERLYPCDRDACCLGDLAG